MRSTDRASRAESAGSGAREGAGAGQHLSAGSMVGTAWHRLMAGVNSAPGLAVRNPFFSLALGLAALLRLMVMAGYPSAVLIRLDSYMYLLDTARARPDPDNTDGYPFFLWLLKPFHSLALVAGLQHLLGLGIAVLVYATLRAYAVPRWMATLATLPALFDPREVLIEHSIMSDTLAALLMVAAFATLLSRQFPSVRRSMTAGLLLGASTLVRPPALPLILLIAAYLLVRRSGWRRVVAALAGGLLPLAGYATWFLTAYGTFNLTASNGLFLWSRTMSFANCAIIQPPPDLRPLCPGQNPAVRGKEPPRPYSWHTLLEQETPQDYLWSRLDWLWKPKPAGYEPYEDAFTPAKNARAQRFALQAIFAQPRGYATVVGEGVVLTFTSTDHTWQFPQQQPRSPRSLTGTYWFERRALRSFAGGAAGLGPHLGSLYGTRLNQPYAHIIGSYQRVVRLPGVVFAGVFVIGLAGILTRRWRSAAGVLCWTSALVVLVLPIAEHQYNYRYALTAVPLAFMAAALFTAGRRNVLHASSPDPPPEHSSEPGQPVHNVPPSAESGHRTVAGPLTG